jgi:hypothetical protein
VADFVALQRSIGNAATSRVVARQSSGAGDTGASTSSTTTVDRPVSADGLLDPVTLALSGITAVQAAQFRDAIEAQLTVPAGPATSTPLARTFPGLYDQELVDAIGRLPMLEQPILVQAVRAWLTQTVRKSVTDRTLAALAKFDGLDYKNSWPSIGEQIHDPKPLPEKEKQRTVLQKTFTALYEEPLLEELTALDAAGRIQVATAVEEALIARIAGAPADTVAGEYERLDPFVKANIEQNERGYVACRRALMATFGSVEGINAYYTTEIDKGADFLGRKITVHRVLKERLDAAVALLDATTSPDGRTWGQIARASLRSAGGFNIRENRNSPTQLSLHSFGWAIDLNAPENPNTEKGVLQGNPKKNVPGSPVEELTGVDLFGGDEYTAIRAGGTAAQILPHAASMREASEKYEAAFESADALVNALAQYLAGEDLLHQPWMKDDLWPTLERAGTQSKFSEQVRQLTDWVQYIWDARRDEEPVSVDAPAEPEQCFPGQTVPELEDGGTCEMEDLPAAVADRIARTLVSAHNAFVQSRFQKDTKKNKKGDEKPADAIGSIGSIAAHGFLDLAPELVAALRGSDGGNLTWLGVASETKDFMHFELQKAQRPALTKIAPNGSS